MNIGDVSSAASVGSATTGVQVAVQKKAEAQQEEVASKLLEGAEESAQRIEGVQTGTSLNVEA